MIHLTLTGYYAGVPLCGANKQAAIERGDTFYHAMYWNEFNHPDLCPDCKKMWEEAEDDDMTLEKDCNE